MRLPTTYLTVDSLIQRFARGVADKVSEGVRGLELEGLTSTQAMHWWPTSSSSGPTASLASRRVLPSPPQACSHVYPSSPKCICVLVRGVAREGAQTVVGGRHLHVGTRSRRLRRASGLRSQLPTLKPPSSSSSHWIAGDQRARATMESLLAVRYCTGRPRATGRSPRCS